jgi:hypothetical protein
MAGLEDRFVPPERFADAADALHALVAEQTGAADFGDDDYLAGLQVLLLSMDHDPRFTEQGRRIAWGELYSALAARAHAVRSMKENPGFDRHPIASPVIITGIPRTGTTALHKLMAVDPQFQGLQSWLLTAPMPRPPRESWEGNALFRNAVERLEARFAADSGLRAAHNIVAEEVDECLGVLRQSFVSNIWNCAWSAQNYDLWWQGQSELPAYRHLYRVLQLIGSNEPGKRWLLKNPGHIARLDMVFAVFPDARVIQTHRDPAKAVPSLCALLAPIHPMMEEGRADTQPRLLALRETEKWARAIRDAEPVRQAHPGQILDVVHGDFHRDPMGTIDRIYAFLGLDLSDQVAAAMAARNDAAPELSHGVHRYDIADFGMTEAGIRARFGDYVDRFGLVGERARTMEEAR